MLVLLIMAKFFCKAMNKNFCKVEISMYDDKKDLIAKAFLSAKGIKNSIF